MLENKIYVLLSFLDITVRFRIGHRAMTAGVNFGFREGRKKETGYRAEQAM
jgi:hypothetical protein